MPTRKDVAQRAGVSEATVSYALSGKRTISQATRERVFEAMRELDYRPNLMAQALAGGSSSIIALLFPSQERGISMLTSSTFSARQALPVSSATTCCCGQQRIATSVTWRRCSKPDSSAACCSWKSA
jgi:DNA-binding LacI/PurR family transcriptional regulator